MHEATEFCLRWNRDEVREPVPQEKGVRQGCSLRSFFVLHLYRRRRRLHHRRKHTHL
jgi:hypothetical protein